MLALPLGLPLALLLTSCGDKAGGDTGGTATPTRQGLVDSLGDSVPATWSTVCLTWLWEWDTDSSFVAFDPGTADMVTLSTRQMGEEDWDVHGMAWDGSAVLTSGEDTDEGGSVARIDVLTGTLERPDTDLVNLVTWGDRLLAGRENGSWAAFASFDDALADSGGESVPDLYDERFAITGDLAYTTKPSGDKFKVWHVPTGTFGELFMDGFDGNIWGLSIVGDRIYLLNDGRQETGKDHDAWVFSFSIDTGAQLSAVDLGVQGFTARGLVCGAR